MASVTQRIKQIKQIKGGYVKPSEFEEINYYDGIELNETENIHPSLVGLVVDYMTRFSTGTELIKAFEISLIGVMCAEKLGVKNSKKLLVNY